MRIKKRERRNARRAFLLARISVSMTMSMRMDADRTQLLLFFVITSMAAARILLENFKTFSFFSHFHTKSKSSCRWRWCTLNTSMHYHVIASKMENSSSDALRSSICASVPSRLLPSPIFNIDKFVSTYFSFCVVCEIRMHPRCIRHTQAHWMCSRIGVKANRRTMGFWKRERENGNQRKYTFCIAEKIQFTFHLEFFSRSLFPNSICVCVCAPNLASITRRTTYIHVSKCMPGFIHIFRM